MNNISYNYYSFSFDFTEGIPYDIRRKSSESTHLENKRSAQFYGEKITQRGDSAHFVRFFGLSLSP
ncbi:hypothetical protein MASR2M79_17030 [Aminivibrio sp.]